MIVPSAAAAVVASARRQQRGGVARIVLVASVAKEDNVAVYGFVRRQMRRVLFVELTFFQFFSRRDHSASFRRESVATSATHSNRQLAQPWRPSLIFP